MLLQEMYDFNIIFIVYRTRYLEGITVSFVFISIEQKMYEYNMSN